jgi:NADH-quinone oxidoreductase subunit J
MFLADITFYLFSAVLLASALVVVCTKNTIYSVMFLILAFFNAAGLFILLGAEFLAMLLVIVYVGAIAVLFLFVVMMLNIDDKPKIKKGFNAYLQLTILIAGILFIEICILTQGSTILFGTATIKSLPTPDNISNTKAIGNVLYTTFAYPFQLAGMVLFVAMIGSIVLTLRDQDRFIKKQNIGQQVAREKSDSVKLVKVTSGQGINI